MSKELKNELDALKLIFQNSTKNFLKLKNELSAIDKKISEAYHFIEVYNPKHVSESHKIFLALKKLLKKRREIKVNLSVLIVMDQHLDSPFKKFETSVNKLVEKDAHFTSLKPTSKDLLKLMKQLEDE